MNGLFIVCFVAMIGFGVALPWAIRADRADREAHLLHRPGPGCPECEAP